MPASDEIELLAQEIHAANSKIEDLAKRLVEVERVTARLEGAALTTARALQEISTHWERVYEAMRRTETPAQAQENEAKP
jgi:hypothetical protein